VTVDGKGNVLSNADYYPFGSIMPGRSGNNGMSHDRTKFTGYLLEEEGEQDTYHAEARGYDPVIGRFTSRDPLVAKFPWVSPYVYVLNNPVNFFDPDGNEPFRVTVRTFIPFSGVMGFKGDNRGPSNSSNASYRTSHSVNVETNPAVSANPLTQDDGGKTGTTTLSENYRDQRNMFNDYMGIGGKANEGQAGGFTASVTRSDANSGDNAVISFVGSSSNPLLPGSPAIDYDFQISIMPGKVGEMPTVQVTGSHDGFPAYEINVQDKNGNAYQVYYHAPSSRWDIRKLLPPNDVEVKE
jgi:RHS repeat-associated protein